MKSCYSSAIIVLVILSFYVPWISAHEKNEVEGTLVLGLTRNKLKSVSLEFDTADLLRIARNRSSMRFHALRKSNYYSLFSVLEPLSIYEDDYVMPLRIGSPPQIFQAYMDTGSDLVWVPCSQSSKKDFFDCIECEHNSIIPTFSPLNSLSSSPEPCTSHLCLDIHTSDNEYEPCVAAGCPLRALLEGSCSRSCPPFSYKYGDGIVTGALMKDQIMLQGLPFPKQSYNFVFGCAGATFNEAVGIVGFGKGALSFPSQLASLLSYKGFSYCLISYRFEHNSNVSSPLILGASEIIYGGLMQYTPMLDNPMYPNYYYIGLEGIIINNTYLEVPLSLQGFDSEGNGGMIIDSGTTYTHLPEKFYKQILSTLQEIIPYSRSHEYEKRTAFDLCYQTTASQNQQSFPTISFRFKNNITIVLPSENHFYSFSPPSVSSNNTALKVHCLLLQSIEDVGVGPAAIFGNFQQQNFQVFYDLEKMRIGFQPKDCAVSA
ncbi:probable aspartyl protease At4g16563 [Cryptomeria japonica]|uniref:probable aspartyl protease At4g16563 n=1 Tax=Cryptomeria japonica TaxID=3369 RepID=UPI0027DA42E9|nr:probable aspartyl protease At4g16563 [Cryptomeria japonica]